MVTHSNNVIVSAGLTFTLGGRSPKSAPAPEVQPAAVPAPKPEPQPEIRPAPVVAPAPAPKPEPQPAPAAVAKPEPIMIVLEDVHFANDRYSLTPAAREILDKNIAKLRENPGLEIEIQGHTSAIGTDEYNMKLSVKRADAVKNYLVKEGIAPERLTTKGYGKTMPEIKEKRPKKESHAAKLNRRVHFEILVK